MVTRLIFHSMIVFSIYLLLAGHNLPGGGFAGGLTAGLALTIRYLAGGRFELREATPVSAGTLLGIGLATAAASGVVPLLLGGQVFQSAIIEFWLPVFGDIKFVTSTIFDIGVYIVVVGLVLDVLRSLGAEIDEHFEERPRRTPETVRGPGTPAASRRNHRQGESMSVNLTLLTVMGALYACGIYLILERSLTRVLLGLMMLTNATNLLILTTGGYAGLAPFFSKDTGPGEYNDPLPAGPDPHVDRDLLRRHGVYARHHLPHLGAGPPGRDPGRRRGPPRRQDPQLRRRGRLRDPGRDVRIPADDDRRRRRRGISDTLRRPGPPAPP